MINAKSCGYNPLRASDLNKSYANWIAFSNGHFVAPRPVHVTYKRPPKIEYIDLHPLPAVTH